MDFDQTYDADKNDGSKTDGFEVHAHVSATRDNRIVLALLFALTALTVGAYRVRLGDANLTVALVIAAVKATLVGTFFMHLKFERAFNTLVFVGTLAFISVFGDDRHRQPHRATPAIAQQVGRRIGEIDHRDGARFDYRYQEWAQGVAPEIRERNGEELRPAAGSAHGASEGAAAEPAAVEPPAGEPAAPTAPEAPAEH